MITAPNSSTGSRPAPLGGVDARQRRDEHDDRQRHARPRRETLDRRDDARERRSSAISSGLLGQSGSPSHGENRTQQRLQHAGDVGERDDDAARAAPSSRPDGNASSRCTSSETTRCPTSRRSPTAPARRRAGGRVSATPKPTSDHQQAGAVVGPAQPGVGADGDEAPGEDEADVRDRAPARRQALEVRASPRGARRR